MMGRTMYHLHKNIYSVCFKDGTIQEHLKVKEVKNQGQTPEEPLINFYFWSFFGGVIQYNSILFLQSTTTTVDSGHFVL